jgi:hypothetical protein
MKLFHSAKERLCLPMSVLGINKRSRIRSTVSEMFTPYWKRTEHCHFRWCAFTDVGSLSFNGIEAFGGVASQSLPVSFHLIPFAPYCRYMHRQDAIAKKTFNLQIIASKQQKLLLQVSNIRRCMHQDLPNFSDTESFTWNFFDLQFPNRMS